MPFWKTLTLTSATAALALATAVPAQAADPWFAPYVRTPIANTAGPGPAPRATVAADFDRDGDQDIVTVTSFTLGNLLLERGNGDGTFGNPSMIPNTIQVQAIDTGDMNDDGNPDLVVMSVVDARVLFGDGTGRFTAGPRYPFALGGQVEPRVVDLDDDGDLDVVAPTFGAIQTLINDGTGALRRGPLSPVAGGPVLSTIAPASLDDDSYADLFAVDGFSGTLFAMRGDGTGRFKVTGRQLATGLIPEDVTAIDLDDDGYDDAASIGSFSFTLVTALTDGAGKFRRSRPDTTRYSGAGPTSLTAADFDRDGRTDLVVSSLASFAPKLKVLAGNGTARMRDAGYYPVALLPQNPVVADFDGDGRPDIVVVGPGALSFLRNTTP